MPNRLAASTSPYLRQHQDNPVDWFEWGDEAFAEAHRRDVPILLSVGYSACHWCHVMAHESFEDDTTAAEMNAQFVNIKVDREERPDVDAVYMEAVQATTGRGGWPMTVFLTPGGDPIYAGTYFPSHDHHGMPSFRKVLAAMTEAWLERRHEAVEQGARMRAAIDRRIPATDELPATATMATAFATIESERDPIHGGLGDAPKFPQQPVLEFLLRILDHSWAPQAASMLSQTLTKMSEGGIYDQIGGGFARYAVDRIWLVPHFEKMLYDNAQLARIYLWAGKELNNQRFLEVATETLEYLRRDLRHPAGGFYAAEDADSEGIEGKFYVWSRNDLLEAAGSPDGLIAADYYGVTETGNFEGSNILHVALTPGEVAEKHGMTRDQVAAAVSRAGAALLAVRTTRVRPGLDHKVVAAWNGLAIRAFAEAGAALNRPDLVAEAEAAAAFVLDEMTDGDGRLHRSWSRGRVGVSGFLEDHASMAVALFVLYSISGEIRWYRAADRLVTHITNSFADPEGGFFSTSIEAPPLIKRPKDQMDNPAPSGNSLAAEALFLHSLFTGDQDSSRAAEATIRSGGLLIERFPSAVGHLLAVAHSMSSGGRELAITGSAAVELRAGIWDRYRPDMAVATAENSKATELIPLLAGRWRQSGTFAYVCRGFVCDAPVTTAAEVRSALDA